MTAVARSGADAAAVTDALRSVRDPELDESIVDLGFVTATTLDDGNTMTALSGSPAAVNITFQSDGTVIDSTGAFARPTLFFYNNRVALETACAISVLGGAGRIKVWKYSTSVNKYAE